MPNDVHVEIINFIADLMEMEGRASVVTQISRFARDLTGAQTAGVTLLRSNRVFETAGATDEIVKTIDDLQYELHEGVCVEAATGGKLVSSGNVGTDPRWPSWGPATSKLGVLSVMSCELHAGGTRIGALNLYGSNEDQFGYDDEDFLRTFAAPASAALAAASKIEGLSSALETRSLIGQAQGVLMVTYDVDAETAFAILARYSRTKAIALRDLADVVIHERSLPTDPR